MTMMNVNIEQLPHKISVYRKINIALVMVTLLITISPYFAGLIPTSVKAILTLLWHVNSFIFENKFKTFTFKSVYFVFFIWIVWCLFLKIIGYSTAEWGNYYLLIAMCDIIIKSFYVFRFYSDREKLILLRIIQIIFLVNVAHNVFIYILNPSVFVSYYYNPEAYRGTNKVSSAIFYQALAFFVMGNVVLLRTERILLWRILAILSIFFSLFFMFSIVPRMNAIVIVIFLLLLYVLQNTKKTINKVALIVVVPLVFASILLFANVIIESLPTRLQVRVESIMYLLQGEEYYAEGSLMHRGELQLNSLRTWINNDFQTFLIGKGLHLGSQYFDVIGQHAFVTNYLAMYGCMGLLFVLYVFIKLRNLYLNAFKDAELRQCAKSMLLGFLFLLCISSGGFTCIVGIASFLFFACMDTNTEKREAK